MLPSRFAAWLTLNRACNLRCDWCYAKMLNFSPKENMSMNTVKMAINLFKGLPLKNVILIGGEPTIHPNFLEIIALVKEAGLHPLLVTNSIRFTDKKFLKETIKAGITGITTSLKAADDEQYEKFTGKRVFSDVMEAISNINAEKIYNKISVTVCDGLFHDFERMLDAITKSGCQMFSLDMERPIIINGETSSPGKASPKEIAKFFVAAHPKIEACGIRFTVKISIPFCLFPTDFIEKMVAKNQIISGCQIFNGSGIIIDQKGRILPCNHFCDNPLGKIGTDFITAEEYIAFRNKPDIKDFYNTIKSCPHQNCVDCCQWKFCGGGCRIHWLHRTADELIGNP